MTRFAVHRFPTMTALLVLFAVPNQAAAQQGAWYLVHRQDDIVTSLDSARIVRLSDSTLAIWTRRRLAESRRTTGGRQYNLQVFNYRVDCARSRILTLETVLYRGAIPVRRIINPERQRNWTTPTAGSATAAVVSEACRRAEAIRKPGD